MRGLPNPAAGSANHVTRKRFYAAIAASLVAPLVSGRRVAAQPSAADVKAFFPVAMRTPLSVLVQQFEQSSGRKVSITYGTIGALATRLQNGEVTDVAILSPLQIDDLEKLGKIVAGSRVNLVKVGNGAFVRKGAPKPDISTVDALKRSLLAAKTIVYVDPKTGGPSGIYMASLMERLGIAAAMTPKTVLTPPGEPSFTTVVKGEADLGFQQISAILEEPTVDYAAPLPAEVQDYTRYTVVAIAAGSQPEGARALIALLSSPAALSVMKAKGFEAY